MHGGTCQNILLHCLPFVDDDDHNDKEDDHFGGSDRSPKKFAPMKLFAN